MTMTFKNEQKAGFKSVLKQNSRVCRELMLVSHCKQSLLSIDALREVHEKRLEDGKSA